MNVGSLFSGIGGLDLGLEWAGMTVVWQSEIDPYACKVLAKHWPNVPNLGDITAIDWSQVEPVDLICGGYPCQPFSLAGVRRGERDPRHLWPHFARAIRLLRPRYALLENVPGHLSMGFGRVLGDLAESGYSVEWDCVPASAVGAPHRRDRVFAVAHTDRIGRDGDNRVSPSSRSEVRDDARGHSGAVRAVEGAGDVPNTDAIGCDRWPRIFGEAGRRQPTHSRQWAVEPDVGRVAHGIPNRLHGGGLDAQASSDPQARSAGASDDDGLLDLWWDGPPTSSPPGLLEADRGGDRLLSLPRDARREGRHAPDSQAEGLHDLRGDVHDVQPLAGEELLAGVSQRSGATQRGEAVGHWATEPDIPRVATGVANRVDRLRCLGNAVVPQVAQWIGEQIMQAAA